jgi:2-succinyl-6-hydroxy-2,4-cyclohexadiene-1-carboxylate synthase
MRGIALHGFLGKAEDWAPFGFEAIDLNLLDASKPLEQIAQELNSRAGEGSEPRLLIGYSLGGRLALQMLKQLPNLWKAAVLISVHLGLNNQDQKQKRIEQDEQWAQRFESEEWGSLLESWNRQPVFGRMPPSFDRCEKEFDRRWLAGALRSWSLGRQPDMQEFLSHLNLPLLWIAGEGDTRCASAAKSLSFTHSKSKIWIAPNAAHRVPWEAEKEFSLTINNFLKGLDL